MLGYESIPEILPTVERLINKFRLQEVMHKDNCPESVFPSVTMDVSFSVFLLGR